MLNVADSQVSLAVLLCLIRGRSCAPQPSCQGSSTYQHPTGEVIQHIPCFFQRTDIKSQSSTAQISFQLACSKSAACNWLLLWGSVLQEKSEYGKTYPPWRRTRLRNIYTNWTHTSLWPLLWHNRECQVSWQMLPRGHTLLLSQGKFPRTGRNSHWFPTSFLHFFLKCSKVKLK